MTGAVPFPGKSAVAIAYAHVHTPVPRLPDGLDDHQRVIDRLMAKDPADRFPNAEAVMDALGDTAQTGAPSNPGPRKPTCRISAPCPA